VGGVGRGGFRTSSGRTVEGLAAGERSEEHNQGYLSGVMYVSMMADLSTPHRPDEQVTATVEYGTTA